MQVMFLVTRLMEWSHTGLDMFRRGITGLVPVSPGDIRNCFEKVVRRTDVGVDDAMWKADLAALREANPDLKCCWLDDTFCDAMCMGCE